MQGSEKHSKKQIDDRENHELFDVEDHWKNKHENKDGDKCVVDKVGMHRCWIRISCSISKNYPKNKVVNGND